MSFPKYNIGGSQMYELPPVTPGKQCPLVTRYEPSDRKWPRTVGCSFAPEKTAESANEEQERHFNPGVPTPKKPRSTVRKPQESEPTYTPPSLRARRRPNNLQNFNSPTKPGRSNSGKASALSLVDSSDTDGEEYGRAISPQLDETAVKKLPPRLQIALRSLQQEREARAAAPNMGDSRPTLRTTALGSHPPTDSECEYARHLKWQHQQGPRATTRPGTGDPPIQAAQHRLRPALKRGKPFMSLNALRVKRVVGGTITQGLSAAKKWAKGLTKKVGGEGVEGEVKKGKGKEKEKGMEQGEEDEGGVEQGEEDEGEVVKRKEDRGNTRVEGMTARGQLESYT